MFPCRWKISDGSHYVEAHAHSEANGRGRLMDGQNITFTVITSSFVDGVTGFSVVDASNNTIFERLNNGDSIDRANFVEGKWSILAHNRTPHRCRKRKVLYR